MADLNEEYFEIIPRACNRMHSKHIARYLALKRKFISELNLIYNIFLKPILYFKNFRKR